MPLWFRYCVHIPGSKNRTWVRSINRCIEYRIIKGLEGFIDKAKAKWERTAHEAGETEINNYEKNTYKALLDTVNPHHKHEDPQHEPLLEDRES